MLESRSMGLRIAAFIVAYLGCFVLAFAGLFIILTVLKPLGDAVFIPALLWVAAILVLTYRVFNVGGSWCATVRPPSGVQAIDEKLLRKKILQLNEYNLPFHVYEKHKGKQLCAEWNIKDKVWSELIARAGVTEQYQMVMEFDEVNKIVRAVDLTRTINWRAGVSLAFSFSYFRGIDLFEYSALKTYGLVRTNEGWAVESDYIYKFDRSEMKTPIIKCIHEGGWTYRPVLFLGGPLAWGT